MAIFGREYLFLDDYFSNMIVAEKENDIYFHLNMSGIPIKKDKSLYYLIKSVYTNTNDFHNTLNSLKYNISKYFGDEYENINNSIDFSIFYGLIRKIFISYEKNLCHALHIDLKDYTLKDIDTYSYLLTNPINIMYNYLTKNNINYKDNNIKQDEKLEVYLSNQIRNTIFYVTTNKNFLINCAALEYFDAIPENLREIKSIKNDEFIKNNFGFKDKDELLKAIFDYDNKKIINAELLISIISNNCIFVDVETSGRGYLKFTSKEDGMNLFKRLIPLLQSEEQNEKIFSFFYRIIHSFFLLADYRRYNIVFSMHDLSKNDLVLFSLKSDYLNIKVKFKDMNNIEDKKNYLKLLLLAIESLSISYFNNKLLDIFFKRYRTTKKYIIDKENEVFNINDFINDINKNIIKGDESKVEEISIISKKPIDTSVDVVYELNEDINTINIRKLITDTKDFEIAKQGDSKILKYVSSDTVMDRDFFQSIFEFSYDNKIIKTDNLYQFMVNNFDSLDISLNGIDNLSLNNSQTTIDGKLVKVNELLYRNIEGKTISYRFNDEYLKTSFIGNLIYRDILVFNAILEAIKNAGLTKILKDSNNDLDLLNTLRDIMSKNQKIVYDVYEDILLRYKNMFFNTFADVFSDLDDYIVNTAMDYFVIKFLFGDEIDEKISDYIYYIDNKEYKRNIVYDTGLRHFSRGLYELKVSEYEKDASSILELSVSKSS